MKNNIYELQKIKEFCKLSGVYFRRLQRGRNVSDLVNQLDNEVFIYEYYKDIKELDKMEYNGFIYKDEDIKENWYALAKAIYDYKHCKETGNKIVDEYMLEMSNR